MLLETSLSSHVQSRATALWSMPANFGRIRDQQRDTRGRFAVGWKDWDKTVGSWLAPVGRR